MRLDAIASHHLSQHGIDKVKELGRQADVIRELVADKAIAVIEKYRNGGYHGREVATILGNLFEAVNDTVEQKIVDEVMKTKAAKKTSESDVRKKPRTRPTSTMPQPTREHVCQKSTGCRCSHQALEPAENCPVHGYGEFPPRCCVCGRFLKENTC